ncbi:MAG: SDR family oxidoreductase [Caulobacteraceae bacterium]|nr:SDR family oxidoreductase [Caulobacteraceae bacterium]
MAKLDGKVALITGGTTGIGAATARLFKAEGASVVVTGANPNSLEAARAELPGIEVVLSDQADPGASAALADAVAARHGRIDILFVNAGVAAFSPLDQLTEEDFDRQFGINVRGALFAAKAAAPHIPQGGSIIFTASTAASLGMAATSVYSASKAAVRSFARSLGAELAPRGVRVNAISPGPIETPIFGKSGLSAEQIEGFKSDITSRVPLGRIGRPEEIAAAVLFLAADATFITGEEIIAGGGMAVI